MADFDLDKGLRDLAPNSYGAMQNQLANSIANRKSGNYATAIGNGVGYGMAGAALPFEYLYGSAKHIGGIAANGVGNFFRGVAGINPSQPSQPVPGIASIPSAPPAQQQAPVAQPMQQPNHQIGINAQIEANRQARANWQAQPAQAPTGGTGGLGAFVNGKQIPLVSSPIQSSMTPEQRAQSIANSQAELQRLSENATIRNILEMPNDRIGPAQQAYMQGVFSNRGNQIAASAGLEGHRIGAQAQLEATRMNNATSTSNNAATNQAGLLKQIMEDQRARELKGLEIEADRPLKEAQTRNYNAQALGETRVAKIKLPDGSETNQFYSSRDNPLSLNNVSKQQTVDPNWQIIHQAAMNGDQRAIQHVNGLAAKGDPNAQNTLTAIKSLTLASQGGQ